MTMIKRYYPYILIFFITFIFFGNTLIPKENQIISAGDLRHIYLPYREFLRNSIFSGELPFWSPYLFSGTPFIAHPYTEFFYPTTLLSIFLPSNLYFSFTFALHVFLAGIFMYLLAKKFTDRLSATTSGIIYAFSGYFASRIYAGHLDYIISSALLPIIFLKSYEYIQENNRKSLLIGSIFLCFQIFTGLISMTFYIFLAIILFHLFITQKSLSPIFNSLKKILFFFILGFGLSSIYFLPSYEFISNTIRGAGLPYTQASIGSSTLQSLFMFINPDFLGSDFLPSNFFHGPPTDYVAHTYFLGITPLLIIFLGFAYFVYKKKLDAKVLALLSITVIFVFISLGPNSPVNLHFILWKILNIYKTTRLPVRHLIVAVFTLSLATGIILKQLKFNLLKIAILLVITFELLNFGKKHISLTKISALIPKNDQVLNKIFNEKELLRILPDYTLNSSVREEISFASPLIYKYFSTSGYTPAILSSYYNFIDKINGNISSSIEKFNSEIAPSFPYLPAINFLNVKYIIVDKTADLLNQKEGYSPIDETRSYKIYENKNYRPRYFFISQAKIYDNPAQLENNVGFDQQNFDKLITIASSEVRKIKYIPDCDKKTETKIRIIDYKLNEVSIEVNSPCNGFIVSSEVYYPGWEAKIDGKKTDVIVSNLAFRAINIPKGEHIIKFYYQPKIFFISLLISGGFVIIAIFYLIHKKG